MNTDLKLKEKYLKKFKGIYYKKTGKNLSDDEALEYFEELITLVNAVYKPIPKSSTILRPRENQ